MDSINKFMGIKNQKNSLGSNYAPKICTGTSILALPCQEGYLLVSDTRATNTGTYEYYTTDKITPYGSNFTFAGAGAAVGTVAVMTPFLEYFLEYLRHYCYDVNQIPDPYAFVTLWNNAAIRYLEEQATPVFVEVLNQSTFIVIFRNKNCTFALRSNLVGDDLLENYSSYSYNLELAKSKGFSGDLLAIGSGARYLLGGALAHNHGAVMKELGKKEILKLLPVLFKHTSARDLASSVESYLEVVSVPKNLSAPITKQRILIE